MGIRLTMAALVFAGTVLAAPVPSAPTAAAECAFEAGNPERANALAQLVRSPEFARQAGLQAGKLQADILGTTVRLTLGGTRAGAALAGLRAAARVVTDEPGRDEMARLLASAPQAQGFDGDQGKVGAKQRQFILRCKEGTPEAASPMPVVHQIRIDRPTLKAPPRLVAP